MTKNKFRGISVSTGEFIYGSLLLINDKAYKEDQELLEE